MAKKELQPMIVPRDDIDLDSEDTKIMLEALDQPLSVERARVQPKQS